jgi:antitoxin ParD1/3/4
MRTRNVTLTEHFDQFIETGVNSGRFGNVSEVVREGLRLLEQREEEDRAKLAWLQAAAKDASGSIERGEGLEFETFDDLAAYVHQVDHEVSTGVRARERKRA